MKTKNLSHVLAILLGVALLASVFHINSASSSGTIYIKPDGSVDPPTASIQRFGDLYIFTADIYDSVVVQKDNVIIDGNGYKLQGAGAGYGFVFSGRANVTIKNACVTGFYWGIYAQSYYANNKIIDNVVAYNTVAIMLDFAWSEPTLIISNTIANNSGYGINLHYSAGMDVEGNLIAGNGGGIFVYFASGNFFGNTIANNNGLVVEFQAFVNVNFVGNTVVNNLGGIAGYDFRNNVVRGNIMNNTGYGLGIDSPQDNCIDSNTITNNTYGIGFFTSGLGGSGNLITNNNFVDNDVGFTVGGIEITNNVIYHNNFVNNTQQVYDPMPPYEVQVWDDGYPSGGNFWSDYNGTDYFNGSYQNITGSDGIGDAPYIINTWDVLVNKDRYPLMSAYGTPSSVLTVTATPGGTTIPTPGTFVYASGSTATVTAIPSSDYLFDHWELDNVNVGSVNPAVVVMDTNHALHAVLRMKPILVITATAGGTTSPSPGLRLYDPDALVPVTAVPYGDYFVDHWELDNVNVGTDNPISVTMDVNHVLLAVFKEKPDIAVTNVFANPQNVRKGKPVYVNVTVENQGFTTETFDVAVYADKDRTIIGDEIFIGTQTVNELVPSSTMTLTFVWSTGTASSGTGYYISAEAIIPQDRDPSDNLLTAKKKVNVRR